MAQSRTHPIGVGSQIGGRYTVERILGQGGMGAVFLAGHARLPGKKVAIKVLHASATTEESLARFRREAEIASRLGHPNIVEVHDIDALEDGTPYLVLEYLEGESLADRLRRGPLGLEETFSIVRQVGAGLAAAHREGIVHRDLKPHNVFLVPVEHDGHVVIRAKVLDFGISKIRGSQTVQTQDSQILGTPQYMAPEQALGNHAAVDQRTDVFALGAMVYEMLAGEPAFPGATIPEVVFKVVYEPPRPLAQRLPNLAKNVIDTVERALSKKADDRFPTVAAFVEALTGTPLSVGKRQQVIAPGDGQATAMSPTAGDRGEAAYAATAASTGGRGGGAGGGWAGGGGDMATDPTRDLRSIQPPAKPLTPTPAVDASSSPPRSSRVVWIAIGLVIAGAAAAVAVMQVMASGKPAKTTVAAVTIDAGVAVAPSDATAVADVADGGTAVDGKVATSDPPTKGRDRDQSRPPEPADPPEQPGDQPTEAPSKDRELAKLLEEARKALPTAPNEAARLAGRVLLKEPGNHEALRIKVLVACQAQDLGNARSWLNRLPKRAKVRRQIARACAKAGTPLE